MVFVSNGAKALDVMETQHFDVVVSDMRMPGMDGAQLLAEVKKRHPDTVRFLLTGQSDGETVYRSVGEAHQFLSKPCKPKVLKECVDKAFALRDVLASDTSKNIAENVYTAGLLHDAGELVLAASCQEDDTHEHALDERR